MTRPLVKICGVTRPEDAELAAALGADYLGLNFHPPSPRFLTLDRAHEVAERVRGRVGLVGVFVNRPRAELEELGEALGLDLFQFHGDETAADIGPLAGRAIKVFRLGADWSPAAFDEFAGVRAFLFEGRHSELYGGTGESWGYERLAALAVDRPVLVAGGIRPGTARRALERSAATGVDVCSGVESAPGIKDPRLLRELFAELRIAPAD